MIMMKMGKKKKQILLTKSTAIFLALSAFISAALLLHFLGPSSSSFSSLSSWVRYKSRINLFPNPTYLHHHHNAFHKNGEVEDEKPKGVANISFSATFTDLPAPELEWEEMTPAPVPRLDGYAVQIKSLLYVFAGYQNLDIVHSHVDVYNFTDNTWSDKFNIPKKMAHSHLGIATDGRYIYVITGQYGPQCRGPIAKAFVLDTETKIWTNMPSLPEPRYAPATQLWKGRLHVMGGSKENRHTPGTDHWSIAVKHGKALETMWRNELPIPRGGPHSSKTTLKGRNIFEFQKERLAGRFYLFKAKNPEKIRMACVAVDDRLYVIGGQEGDFMAKPGSPIFKCSRRKEVVYGDVYMLDDEKKWHVLPPMPKPDSHIECSWVLVNNSIIIVGGTTAKHPVTKRMILVGEVFRFDLDSQEWSVIGKLPYRVKTALAGYWNGWLYFTSGQRDRGPDDPSPRKVVANMWRTNLSL